LVQLRGFRFGTGEGRIVEAVFTSGWFVLGRDGELGPADSCSLAEWGGLHAVGFIGHTVHNWVGRFGELVFALSVGCWCFCLVRDRGYEW